MLARESSATLLDAVTAFIYREARFQDEHQYEAWEALWTDDGVYWVPANGADIDPEKEMSIIYDWCPISSSWTSSPAATLRWPATA
jgi:3-phenylpropionate/cinnamic acid dioxygenase small subunit